jgi:hypothetical protein
MALSFVLLIAGVFLILLVTPFGKNLAQHGSIWYEHGDPFEMMSSTMWLFDFILSPLIAFGVGTLTGVLAKSRVSWVAVIGLLPFTVFLLMGNSFSLRSLVLCVSYLLLAVVVAVIFARIRTRSSDHVVTSIHIKQ